MPLLVIAAGGTGGHMFPAQALAEEMLSRGWTVRLATDARGARYAGGFSGAVERQVLKAGSFAQGGLIGKLTTPFRIGAGVLSASAAMRKDKPACVAGFGGYPALPTMAAAVASNTPFLIHEQNGVLGRVNKLFARKATLVALGIKGADVPGGKRVEYVGNPVRGAIREKAGAAFEMRGGGPLNVLVMGGSQGARIMSERIPEAIGALPEDIRARLTITQQARPEDEQAVKNAYEALGINADIRSFIDNVPELMEKAHLVISRAGASSVAEIGAVGRPSILIPYAAAMDDHQTANAAALKSAGAAYVLSETEATAAALAAKIETVLADPEGAHHMAQAAKSQGRPDAAKHLADLVEEIAKTKG
ncbi:undecaprenyldiphospho-muramoylpentapeptide beta-N-acetylglucosaminyltransferase [Paracoccaceae bacterium GXU_MW_L88]